MQENCFNDYHVFTLIFLGFDPWNECSKGLADMLQEEEQTTKPASVQHISTASHTHSFLPSFPRDVRQLF